MEKFKGLPNSVPESELSIEFLQGMADRSAVSFFKYGYASDAFPNRVDALESMHQRLKEYFATKNTEFLIDAANFLMFEFMHPSIKGAHFTPTDSHQSPGRTRRDGTVDGEKNIRTYIYKRQGD